MRAAGYDERDAALVLGEGDGRALTDRVLENLENINKGERARKRTVGVKDFMVSSTATWVDRDVRVRRLCLGCSKGLEKNRELMFSCSAG